MIAWFRQHRRALQRAFGKLAAQRSAGAFNVLVIGVGLSLPVGGYCLLANLGEVAREVRLDPRISIFMRPGTARAEGRALASRLESDSRISEVRFVSREEALDELRSLEELAALLKGLDRNPLPDALLLRTRDSSAASLDRLAGELRGLPGVEYVQLDALWARRLAALAALARWSLALLATLLSLGLIA
ncbi:MAG: permease-like cell division protein FtsX, partial [Betaproteobacteria bacterium]|nr:permease-like cell division protein FtsX [Betaproteobacteria bacterium]